MVLAQLQTLLSELYAIDVEHSIDDFVLTDARVVGVLDAGGRELDEKLLIAERGDEAGVSLYLDAGVLNRLSEDNPASCLSTDNVEDFWTALEGVSHFLYYVWNATLEKSVTLMEMELQAEVDKFIATVMLLRLQGERVPSNLHRCLFDRPSFDARLESRELERYRSANRYAGKYCQKLAPRLIGRSDASALRSELCYFYRLPQSGKIRHIEAT
jgi:hypothetical protein